MRLLLSLLLCGCSGCATADYTEADYLNNQHTPPAVARYDKFVRAINDYDQLESNKRVRKECVPIENIVELIHWNTYYQDTDMPKALENKLRKQAAKSGITTKDRMDAYVYGTMRKTGWVPSTQKAKK